MAALRDGLVVPTVEQLVAWANSTSEAKTGSLHLHPERWEALLGVDHPSSRIARDGSVLKMLPPEERPAPRAPWYPPQTENEGDIMEEMILEALHQGAIVPIFPADVAATEAAGLPTATVATFCVSKNKPGAPPCGGSMEACRAEGPAAVKALCKRWRLVSDFSPME